MQVKWHNGGLVQERLARSSALKKQFQDRAAGHKDNLIGVN